MDNKKIFKFVKGLIGICGIFIVQIALLYMFSYGEDIDDYIVIDSDVTLTVNDSDFGKVTLSDTYFDVTNRGDVITMTMTLPECDASYNTIELHNCHSTVEAYVDGELIYKYGVDRYKKGQLVGYGVHFITLPDDFSNRELKIVECVTENDAFTSMETMTVRKESDYYRDFLNERKSALFISVFLIMLGFFVMYITIMLKQFYKKFYKMYWVAVFAMCIGVWTFANNNFIQLFTTKIEINTFLEFFSLYLAPIPVLAYFYEDVENINKKKLSYMYKILLYVILFFVVITYSLQLLNIVHIPASLKYMHIISFIGLILITYILGINIKRRILSGKIVLGGMVSLVIICGVDLLNFNMEKYYHIMMYSTSVNLLPLSALILVACMLAGFCTDITHGIIKEAGQKTLEKLAYTDSLTGLGNRTMFEKKMDECDEIYKDYCIINFDLNRLKSVNDTYGHDMGDIYISSFGKIIKSVFEEISCICRTGGDEFVVIAIDISEKKINDCIEKMHMYIADFNEEEEKINMSVSYGVAYSQKNKNMRARQLYKMADELMYSYKKNNR